MTVQLPALLPDPRGVRLAVRAAPGARKTGLRGVRDGALVVAVAAAPEKGKANAAIIEQLAASLGLKRSQVVLLRGATSPQKEFLLVGATEPDLRERLAADLAEG